MAMNVQSPDHDDAELNTTINTTPLVDVMLVLLIIFLITIPVIVKVVPVNLPNAKNIPTITKPENIVISVDKDENVYINNALTTDNSEVIHQLEQAMLRANSEGRPLPEVHIRADDCQIAAVPKSGFLTEPKNDSAS
jgi:biopolymer transport protein ExbD